MHPFSYTRANNVADALRHIVADPAAKFIAGAGVFKVDHDCPIACRIAATMLG